MILRPLTDADEAAARRAQAELAREDFTFLLELRDGEPWASYLARLADISRGVGLAADRVPATFLVAEVDGEVAGRVSVRHTLNAWLLEHGGHIGYGVRPAYRRRGIATAMLRGALGVAAAVGVTSALLTCDDDNVGSAAVIERCGGVLDAVTLRPDGAPQRRYWLPTT